MKIGIIGSGGVGGYFGIRLAQAGNDVKFLARGAHLEAIAKNGFTLKSIKGNAHLSNPDITSKLDEFGDRELLIIATKAWQVKDIGERLSKIINPDTLILPLQNGVMAESELQSSISRNQILTGLCMIFSVIEEAGVIHHKGLEPKIIFGSSEINTENQLFEIRDCFKEAGISTQLSNNSEAELWKKFMLICLSALGCITHSGYGKLRTQKEMRHLILQILTEIYTIAKAKGIMLPANSVKTCMDIVDTYPPDSMSSLARDVLTNRPSEIEYQNGSVIKFGKELNIPTPANQFVYACVKVMEMD